MDVVLIYRSITGFARCSPNILLYSCQSAGWLSISAMTTVAFAIILFVSGSRMSCGNFDGGLVLGKLIISFYLTLESEGSKALDPLVNIFLAFHDGVESV